MCNTPRSEEMDQGTVYILQLKHGKYYVGHTARCDGERFNEHFRQKGAEWTKRYKPVIVLRKFNGTLRDEDETTLQMNAPPKRLLQRTSAASARTYRAVSIFTSHRPTTVVS